MQRREQREYSWWRADSWNFKGGNTDQGLIAHSFLRGAGAGVRVVVAGTDFGAHRIVCPGRQAFWRLRQTVATALHALFALV